jgi:hypothetical protein
MAEEFIQKKALVKMIEEDAKRNLEYLIFIVQLEKSHPSFSNGGSNGKKQ